MNKNLSLCETGCTFSGYDPSTKRAACNCNVKFKITDIKNLKIDKNAFLDGFFNFKSLINLNVMKCFRLIFTKNGFLHNIANYILLPITLYNIISSIVFYLKGYDLLKNQIQKMVEELKEYQNNNSKIINENLTDKNVKIYNKKEESKENKEVKIPQVIKKKKKRKKN